MTEFVRTTGSVARGLTALAERQRADLLVIGSSRPALIGRILPGLAALRLLHGAPCAFSIAPAARSAAGRFRHVGIAYDGSPEAAGALTAGYELAARHGAAVSLYYVNVAGALAPAGGSGPELDPADQRPRLAAQERLDAAAGAAPTGVNPRTVLLHGDPAREIARATEGIVDVLFTGSRGYGPMHRAHAGSVSEALLLTSTHPVVVTPRSGVTSPVPPGETGDSSS